ncbi:MAG: hypothetical protein HCA25_14650 [Dolichospermum sp. DET50]|nr:hypothetical protein [Dolichospermum sp. DET66]MBS3033479.1 hypothetical protein [Dolichospermum sp. DET67]MBS3038683.1 hypothetical protein [Dolichospermum sp. DET50]QSX65959.1 MAG: hypothetical protein EZY12_13900 [Dolichospermum sp. DET69]
MPPLPPYLIFITVVLVIIPSIFTIFLRISLYRYLIKLTNKVQRLIKTGVRGEQPKIVITLEDRFQQASRKLDQINTAALIDQVYSQEKIKGFTCEQIDYLCRILPNLLLAFGLLGTFLGITINLSTLSQTINQANANDVSNLVTELKKPLEGMSIAFTTSLTGLFFSALLTVFNFIFNAGLAKYCLISSLEDYLDNIYLPEVQGDNRLDKIVNKMVSQQDEFLTNFGETVRKAVEQSMGKVAQQIADGNKETTDLARQVYERFNAAAGTISSAANEFKNSIPELNAASQIFKQSANIFHQSQFPQQLSAATADLSNTQQKFSESAAKFAQTSNLMVTVLIKIEDCSQNLINLSEDIKNINQTSIQVLDLHQTNQNALSEIIPKLQQGANSFSEAINQLDQLEIKISDKADSLNNVEIALNQLLEFLQYNTEQMNLAFDKQIDHNHQQFQTFISNTEGYTNQFIIKIDTIKLDLIELLQNNNVRLTSEYQNVSNIIVQGIDKQTNINTKGLAMVIKNIQECNKHLNDTKNSINQLRQVMKTPE